MVCVLSVCMVCLVCVCVCVYGMFGVCVYDVFGVCVCVYMCIFVWRPEEGVRCLEAGVTGGCVLPHCVCWELKPGPLQRVAHALNH